MIYYKNSQSNETNHNISKAQNSSWLSPSTRNQNNENKVKIEKVGYVRIK